MNAPRKTRVARLHDSAKALETMWRTGMSDWERTGMSDWERIERIERAHNRVIARIHLERIDISPETRIRLLERARRV